MEFIENNFDASLPVMENARRFNKIDPTRSVKGWEMKIHHWRNEGGGKSSYVYDEDEDVYTVYIASSPQPIVVSGKKHRDMMLAYSELSGSAMSLDDMALEFDLPKNWIKEYKRIFGWTRSMLPVTDETLANQSKEETVETILNARKNSVYRELDKVERKNLRKDAMKYRNFKELVLDEFKQIVTPAEPVEKISIKKIASPYALVISPTDFHWGKYGWFDEVGEKYNFEEAKKRLMSKTKELVNRLYGRPDEIILAAGSDWFHVDNDNGTTTRGTPQDMCGSPAEILMTGCQMAREHIDLLRQVAPVKVVFMAGNHDRMSTVALMMYLSAVYEESDDCEVVVSPKTRQYVRFGNNLLGFIHGDGAKNLVELMSVEQRKLWGECEHHVWFHGHLHHQKLTEKGGALIVQLPSLAGHDRYHYRQGYTTSKAGLSAYMIDYEKGLIGSLFAPV